MPKWPDASAFEVTSQGFGASSTVRAQGSGVLEQSVSPVCAVTHSMSVLPSVDVSKADAGKGKDAEFALMWPSDLASVSRVEFVKDQNDDLSLK